MARVVLLGAGHAHMPLLCESHKLVEAGHDVCVVSPRPYHYYSGMGPGMFARRYTEGQNRFPASAIAEKNGVSFVIGKALRIDHQSNIVALDDGGTVEYDVLSCNIGSDVVPRFPVDGGNVFPVKPIENLVAAGAFVDSFVAQNGFFPAIVIVGGGVGGSEMAANSVELAARIGARIDSPPAVIAPRGILPGYTRGMRRRVRSLLRRRGVRIVTGRRVQSIRGGRQTVVTLDSGLEIPCDMAFLCTGVSVPGVFVASGLSAGDNPALAVGATLQSVSAPNILGGGDCINFLPYPLDKVGVYAVRQQEILRDNVFALATGGGQLRKFMPQKRYLVGLNMGFGNGVLGKWGVSMTGPAAFALKDYIDRGFIRSMRNC